MVQICLSSQRPAVTDQLQWSNEIRWSGSFGDSWESVIGFYYFDQDNQLPRSTLHLVATRAGSFPTGSQPAGALGGDMDSKNFGAFWSNDFHVGDAWTITAGLRYTDERKSAQIIIGGCADNTNFDCETDNLSGDWDNITPKVGGSIQGFRRDAVVRFLVEGFPFGWFNFRNARPDVIPPGPTKEEESNTIEVGFKSDFMDGKMRLNVAVFQNEIKDMQRELNMGDPQVIVLQATINAGDVTIKGLAEVDFIALVSDNFSINMSYGWQDGEYDSFDPFVPAFEALLRQLGALGPNEVLIGSELPRLAPTNYNVGFSWDIPLGSGLINLMANHSFRERHPYNDSNTEFFEDQRRTNASVNWFSADDKLSVSLYGKNLEDEANWGNLTSIAGLYRRSDETGSPVIGIEINFRR